MPVTMPNNTLDVTNQRLYGQIHIVHLPVHRLKEDLFDEEMKRCYPWIDVAAARISGNLSTLNF